MALTAGTRLGPYEVTALIGAGGMGEVYRATDTRLDRTVAIKVLPEHLVHESINTITYKYFDWNVNLVPFPEKEGIAVPRSSPFSIDLSFAERNALESRARQYTSSYRDVIRAKIILLAAEGSSNDVIAARLDTPRQIVSKWRKRFFYDRLAGLEERPRGGRPALFSPQRRC